MKIFVNASEIAGICGMHKYRSSETALEDVWMKNYRNEAKDLILTKEQILAKKCETLTADVMRRLANENIELGSTNTKVITELQSIQPDDHVRAGMLMAEVITDRANLISKVQNTNDMIKLDKHLETIIDPALLAEYNGIKHCARGIVNEDNDLNTYEQTTDELVVERNDKVYRKVILSTVDDDYEECTYIVCGRVDGITNGDTIVESKNRMHRLFECIPEYEQVQLEVYLWLTGFTKAILIQSHNSNQSVLHYEKSLEKWSEIMMNFELFHEKLQMFRNDKKHVKR